MKFSLHTAEKMIEAGATWTEVCTTLGLRQSSVQQGLYAAHRKDLVRQLKANSHGVDHVTPSVRRGPKVDPTKVAYAPYRDEPNAGGPVQRDSNKGHSTRPQDGTPRSRPTRDSLTDLHCPTSWCGSYLLPHGFTGDLIRVGTLDTARPGEVTPGVTFYYCSWHCVSRAAITFELNPERIAS